MQLLLSSRAIPPAFSDLKRFSPIASVKWPWSATKNIAISTLIGIAAMGACDLASARTLTGVVTHITDGDTLWVRTSAHGQPRKVRIQGMDAPESCQAWGPQATAALASRVANQTVQLNHKGGRAKDEYGRLLANVSVGGQDVGAWMVANGHAWSYHYRRSAGPYAAEQAQAQSARRGLWGGAAVEPRVFRKQHGSCK